MWSLFLPHVDNMWCSSWWRIVDNWKSCKMGRSGWVGSRKLDPCPTLVELMLWLALILYRRRRFINHLLTYLLTYSHWSLNREANNDKSSNVVVTYRLNTIISRHSFTHTNKQRINRERSFMFTLSVVNTYIKRQQRWRPVGLGVETGRDPEHFKKSFYLKTALTFFVAFRGAALKSTCMSLCVKGRKNSFL